jgi:hypothetical protein
MRWWRSVSFPERLALVGLVVATVGLVPAYLSLRDAPRSSGNALADIARNVAANQRELSARISATTQEVQQLRSGVDGLQKPTSQGRLVAQVVGMNAKVRQVDQEVSALQDAILRDPAKALEVPLLRRDIESSQLANQAALATVRQDIDRQYDLMKWICGMPITGADLDPAVQLG